MTRRKRPGAGTMIGGILAGIDGQIFRSTPPAHELVRRSQAVRDLTGEDGSSLAIELPDDGASSAASGPDRSVERANPVDPPGEPRGR